MVKTPNSFEKVHMEEAIGAGDEDAKVLPYLSKHEIGNYTIIPKKAGVRSSCGKKSCKIRWNNKRNDRSFSTEEEELIIKLHATIGSRWAVIAQQLPGRTDDEVKNLWNKRLKKKLTAIGIDPITHRPFSQILADYGNIGAFPKARNHHFNPNKDQTRNEFTLKSKLPFSPFEPALGIPTFSNSQTNSDWTRVTPAESNYYSLELLSQLQSITMVTPSGRVPIECVSSSSSSPSPESPPGAKNMAIINGSSSSSFSWSDFLVEDAFLPTNIVQEQENNGANFPIKKEEDHNKQRDNENHIAMKSTIIDLWKQCLKGKMKCYLIFMASWRSHFITN